MARLYDSSGKLLGGLDAAQGQLTTFSPVADVPRTHLNPNYGPEESVPGLECSYGSLAYTYDRSPLEGAYARPQFLGCHSSVEDPEERHYCEFCGGDYCSSHAERAAHDCENVILPD